MSGDQEIQASEQLRAEIFKVITRYGDESDITVYQTIGVLEVVKLDLLEMTGTKYRRDQKDKGDRGRSD